MPEFDVIVRGGTIVDGTGFPRYRSDLAIADGRIAQIGGLRRASARSVLDASGLIVAPGFVDLHTHYDAQIQWDPWCTISGWHGVTSVVLGNCGFGFAPVRPEERERAMLMMTRNEAIPYESMKQAMLWDWETFPEWLDSLERIAKGVNVLSYVPISPVLVWVMGLDAAKSRPATEDERREMQRLVDEAMDAGACGWSVQRLGRHSIQGDYDGTPMPTDTMADDDILALAEVLARRDEGFIQISQAVGGDTVAGMRVNLQFEETLAEVSGRPILHNVVGAVDDYPEVHRPALEWVKDCNRRGLRMFAQGNSVRAWFTFSLRDDWNLYDSSPAWNQAMRGTLDEKMVKLSDPDVRAGMIAEERKIVSGALGGPIAELTVHSIGSDDPQLQRHLGRTLGEIAAEKGTHHIEAMLDLAVACELDVEFKTHSATSTNPDLVAEVFSSPYVIPGVSDGGAHTKFFTGGSYTTDFLSWLVRDTEKVSLEDAHQKLSYLPAQAAGFKERGLIREGTPADIVVYDLAELRRVPDFDYEVAHDFPGGEWRRVQRAEGYRYIIVNGKVTFEDGKCTGATPGKLLRHGKG